MDKPYGLVVSRPVAPWTDDFSNLLSVLKLELTGAVPPPLDTAEPLP
jgi:hypothetical protein